MLTEIDESRFRRLEEDLNRLSDRFDKNTTRSSATHEEIFQRLNALEQSSAVASAVANERFDTVIDQLADLKTQQAAIIARLDTMAQKPAKRWDIAVTAVITAIGSGIVGFVGYIISKTFDGGM